MKDISFVPGELVHYIVFIFNQLAETNAQNGVIGSLDQTLSIYTLPLVGIERVEKVTIKKS